MEKSSIKIIADSTCDLPGNIIEQYDITVINNYVKNSYGVFIDNEEITSDNVIDYFNSTHRRLEAFPPKTGEYEKVYKSCLEKYHTIIHLVLSKNMSKSYSYAAEAAKNFENVYVIDSNNLSVGYGMLVMKAAELCRTGMSADAIVSEIKNYRNLIKFKFIMESLDVLENVGKVSFSMAEIAKLFKVHFDLKMKNGKLQAGNMYFGKMPWVYKQFVKSVLDTKNIDTRNLFIVSVGCSNKFVENIQEQIAGYYKFDNIFAAKASSAIACNCNCGTIGIAYASFNIK